MDGTNFATIDEPQFITQSLYLPVPRFASLGDDQVASGIWIC